MDHKIFVLVEVFVVYCNGDDSLFENNTNALYILYKQKQSNQRNPDLINFLIILRISFLPIVTIHYGRARFHHDNNLCIDFLMNIKLPNHYKHDQGNAFHKSKNKLYINVAVFFYTLLLIPPPPLIFDYQTKLTSPDV
jgi:hypothetical protein